MIADYHLDAGATGIEVLASLAQEADVPVPGLIVTADHSGEADQAAASAGYRVLKKPVKPAALRAVVSRLVLNA